MTKEEKFSESETAELLKSPAALQALVDMHDYWESCSDAMDMADCAKHHKAQREMYFSLLGHALIDAGNDRAAHEPLSVPTTHREGREPLSRIIGDIDYLMTTVDPLSAQGMAIVRIGSALRNLNGRASQPPSDDEPIGWIRYDSHNSGGPEPEQVYTHEFLERSEGPPPNNEGWDPVYYRPAQTNGGDAG